MSKNELEFSVDSQLLGELGERLVTRNYIAMAELIKNSYDADATRIIVRFVNAKRGGTDSEIHLVDNGHGMSFTDVRDHWMRIATTYKAREPISPVFGRRKTGSKGLGRFACRRLAQKLILETTAKVNGSNELEWTRVIFDWKEFIPGTTLTEIPCKYETGRLKEGATGLSLKLLDLLERWSESEFNLLRRQVLSLSITKGTRRDGFEEDPGFGIVLETAEFPEGKGFLADQFMDAGWGKLEGNINGDGICHLKLEAKEIGTKNYELSERSESLKGIAFEIAWLPIFKEYFRDTKILTKTVALEVMREQGGVRVYLDGFRVYPYGDVDDDWLGIEADVARRWGPADSILRDVALRLGIDPGRAMLNHPRNRNLIGRVYMISRTDMPFQVKLDREGFIKNKAYEELIRAIRLSIQWMVLHYINFLHIVGKRSLEEAEKELEPYLQEAIVETPASIGAMPVALKAVDLISTEAKRAFQTLPDEEREKSEAKLQSAKELIQRSFIQTETYLAVLRGAASTGALMFNFSHEVKNLMAKLETHANTLDRIIEKLPPDDREDFRQFARSLRTTRDRLDQQIRLFGTLVRMTADTERRAIPMKHVCDEVVKGFQYLIKEYGMNEVQLDVPDTLSVGPILEVELYSVIVNLLSNAIKANLAGRGQNILIQAFKRDSKTNIRVFDDGIGLSENRREEVFQPLNADPDGRLSRGLRERISDQDLAALGRGSGVGLNIVRNITEAYGGTAHFIDAKLPWKTCVEVVLP